MKLPPKCSACKKAPRLDGDVLCAGCKNKRTLWEAAQKSIAEAGGFTKKAEGHCYAVVLSRESGFHTILALDPRPHAEVTRALLAALEAMIQRTARDEHEAHKRGVKSESVHKAAEDGRGDPDELVPPVASCPTDEEMLKLTGDADGIDSLSVAAHMVVAIQKVRIPEARGR